MVRLLSGTFLIVGFTLHNTTEGLAIVAPLARANNKATIGRLVILGIIAGSPAIVGAWIGGFFYSPIAAIIFLAIGAGAIFQVAFSILTWISNNNNSKNTDPKNEADSKERSLPKKKGWLDLSSIVGFVSWDDNNVCDIITGSILIGYLCYSIILYFIALS